MASLCSMLLDHKHGFKEAYIRIFSGITEEYLVVCYAWFINK